MTLQSIADGPTDRLAKNSVGLAHIVFFVVAAAAPLTLRGPMMVTVVGDDPKVSGTLSRHRHRHELFR